MVIRSSRQVEPQFRQTGQSRQSGEGEGLQTGISRYDRQELIRGWDQSALTNSKLIIVGSGVLANYTALTAAALGFGNIELFGPGSVDVLDVANSEKDFSKGFSYFSQGTKVDLIANFVSRINPEVKVTGINLRLDKSQNLNLISAPSVIIDTTNNPYSKFNLIEYGIRQGIPVVSASCSETRSKLGVYDPITQRSSGDQQRYLENILFAEFTGQKQSSILSSVMSALAVEEARKKLMPINGEKTIEDILIYNLNSLDRFKSDVDFEFLSEPDDFKDKTVLMVGAGALGNFAGLELALNNIGKLIMIDDDDIEQTNLNRQVLFYDAVGRLKATTLAERLQRINPNLEVEIMSERLTPASEHYFSSGEAFSELDLMIDTVDNNKARALLNYYSTKYGIPLISGGTRYNSGQVVVSIPGQTACLDCKVDIDKLAISAHAPQSCILAAQPSVITSNQIIGGMIVGEARCVLRPDKYGPASNKILKYISQDDFRIGSLPAAQSCSCHHNEEKIGSWMEKMAYLYV
ncbi:ThiF family adenylyltransferase [Candidatus Woesearchaeota archaeon]|jgi:molybdopterin/thiamine biosynthesis adenylyltransferase|nr:ThiF family adenylyltransferase [Candidatus Woesearchaeota archaeon]